MPVKNVGNDSDLYQSFVSHFLSPPASAVYIWFIPTNLGTQQIMLRSPFLFLRHLFRNVKCYLYLQADFITEPYA